MSLSFVASAVQTGTADGGYEEKAIENQEVANVNKRNASGHKPLFEQLRANQEAAQAKSDELQQQMLRGTCALDEEDVAHLDALHRQRLDREQAIQQRTQDEVAMFRAARAEQLQKQIQKLQNSGEVNDDGDGGTDEGENKTYDDIKNGKKHDAGQQKKKAKPAIKPKVVVKKKRKSPENEPLHNGLVSKGGGVVDASAGKKQKENSAPNDSKTLVKIAGCIEPVPKNAQGNLGGLLCGYGSSSDESH